MKASELCRDIKSYCEKNSNEAIVKKYSRYFKEGYDAYGLTLEQLESKVSSVLSGKTIDKGTILKTCRLLIKGKRYEETSFAYLFLKSYSKEFNKEIFRELECWFETGIRNWAHTDVICGELLSVLLKKNIINLKSFAKWRKANNKFQRRAVPVAMIKLLKITKDFKPLFTFIEPLMIDEAREVHQGLGWFLREAWKIDNKSTEKFLLKWKNKAPRLIFQYATEKMALQKKQKFRRGK
jgi:3-methyladenine DNA glycosylase AlkD